MLGTDVCVWYNKMPKRFIINKQDSLVLSSRKHTAIHVNRFKINKHFQHAHCLMCGSTAPDGELSGCLTQSMNQVLTNIVL